MSRVMVDAYPLKKKKKILCTAFRLQRRRHHFQYSCRSWTARVRHGVATLPDAATRFVVRSHPLLRGRVKVRLGHESSNVARRVGQPSWRACSASLFVLIALIIKPAVRDQSSTDVVWLMRRAAFRCVQVPHDASGRRRDPRGHAGAETPIPPTTKLVDDPQRTLIGSVLRAPR